MIKKKDLKNLSLTGHIEGQKGSEKEAVEWKNCVEQ